MPEGRSETFYYQIHEGLFKRKVPTGTPGATTRTENGYELNEVCVSWISGYLYMIGIRTIEASNGKTYEKLIVSLKDQEGERRFEDWIDGRFANKFLRTMENVHLREILVVKAGTYKGYEYIKLSQNGETVPEKYQKSDDPVKPNWEKYQNEYGETRYDKTDELAFFRARIAEMSDRLAKFHGYDLRTNHEPEDVIIPRAQPVVEPEEDDAPF